MKELLILFISILLFTECILALPGITECVAGSGTDYQVGPNQGQLASLDLVPWEDLAAGDTVRLFYKSDPYRGKILLTNKGTAGAWIRVCGVKGANGERPIIDGENAVARLGLKYTSADYGPNIQETRSIIMIDRPVDGDFTYYYPQYLQIDGLEIRGQHPRNSFTNSFGDVQNYDEFGACIWINRGWNITIADNEIHDCTNGIFSRSVWEGNPGDTSAAVGEITRSLLVSGNYIHGNGVSGSYSIHNTYIQTVGVIYEFNRYGPLRDGSAGGGLKDRSVGTIVRYNWFEGGSYGVDLVEAEDYWNYAITLPEYFKTYVYGNVMRKDGATGSFFHYGGDHPAASNPSFKKGDLYFFHNTVHMLGDNDYLFRISSIDEKVHVWNNVLWFNTAGWMRMGTDLDPADITGGLVTLGKNWFKLGWEDTDQYHPMPVEAWMKGAENVINGTTMPFDQDSFVPLVGSGIINVAEANLEAVAHLPVEYQLDNQFQPVPRLSTANAGAFECCYHNCPANTVECPATPLVSPAGLSPNYQGNPNGPTSANGPSAAGPASSPPALQTSSGTANSLVSLFLLTFVALI